MKKLFKKRMKRRTLSRKATAQDSVINTAEARREIVHALHLHRLSSSKPTLPCVTETRTSRSNSGNNIGNSSQYHCYSLTEAMPLPEPIWSTTATSVPVAAPAIEALQLDNWGDNQASSYSWWSRFLKSMDQEDESRYPCAENVSVMPNSNRVFSHKDCSKLADPVDYQSSVADDWLIFPTIDTQIPSP